MFKNSLLPLLALIMISLLACTLGKHQLTVQFNATEGLKVEDPVVFQQNRIGTVRQIRYTTQGNYLVDIVVEPEFKNALTVDSQFYIDSDPGNLDGKALIVEQSRAGGTLLADKALVMGTEKPSPWRQMLDTLQQKSGEWEEQLDRKLDELRRGYEEKSTEVDRDLDAAIAELNRQLRELQEAMRRAASSEEMQALRRSAEELLAELQQRLAELGVQQQSAGPNSATKEAPASKQP